MKGKDRLSKARRSWNMSRVRGKNTKPEMNVRSMLHKMGYRFRLHVKIPVPEFPRSRERERMSAGQVRVKRGKQFNEVKRRRRFIIPDIVLPKYKTAANGG